MLMCGKNLPLLSIADRTCHLAKALQSVHYRPTCTQQAAKIAHAATDPWEGQSLSEPQYTVCRYSSTIAHRCDQSYRPRPLLKTGELCLA